MVMDWLSFLFSFHGRINRAKAWLAMLLIVGWMVFLAALTVAADKLLGIPTRSVNFNLNDIFGAVDPATYRHALALLQTGAVPAGYVVPMFLHAVGTALFIWVYAATSIKRLHDRDRSGWWLVPFFIAPGLYEQFAGRLPDSYLVGFFAWCVFALYLWGFVEIYFLKGTRWTNRFGPNPLGKQQTRPRSTEARLRTTTAWDQEGEIEIAPHTGSPPPAMHVNRRP
jgi:uncharacterized membrane protein YhaH (DUF805 family)